MEFSYQTSCIQKALAKAGVINSIAKTDVLGVPVSPEGVGELTALLERREPGKALTITCVNPHACHVVCQQPEYRQLLERFDYVTCDGTGMVLAGRLLGLSRLKRQSPDFTSLAGPMLEWAGRCGISVGIIGGRPGVAKAAAESFRQLVPSLRITGVFSGFADDVATARNSFAQARTELVLCGMGAPLQEKFLLDLVAGGWHGIGITCGGLLDQTSKGTGFYPVWIDRLNIRFLYRLFREPGRLWRRYLIDYQVFMVGFARLLVKALKSRLFRARN